MGIDPWKFGKKQFTNLDLSLVTLQYVHIVKKKKMSQRESCQILHREAEVFIVKSAPKKKTHLRQFK